MIFDFSGTLFRCEPVDSWLRAVLADAGIDAADDEVGAAVARLRASGAMPGLPPESPVPAHLSEVWARRDLAPDDHRAAYTALARQAALPWPGLEDALYERHRVPQAWHPFPDTTPALRLLRDRGVPVAVLSNIAWDVRPTFQHHGTDEFISGYVLSFREGMVKPDPRIFGRACELLGHDPAEVLMVGDNVVADGGASAIGCTFRTVAHLPPQQRPSALLEVVSDVG